MSISRSGLRASVLACVFLACALAHAAPTAAVNASPSTGRAPLGVFFDAGSSTLDSVRFFWDFGDGATSTSKTVTHIYTVAGTYTAKLTVTDLAGASNTSQVAIVVTGSGEGPVTDNMNFRLAITNSTFTLPHAAPNKGKLILNAVFNTVDLPEKLEGVPASFSVNGLFTVTGVLGQDGGFLSPEKNRPFFFVNVSPPDQTLFVELSSADLSTALAASGATNASVKALVPVSFTLTVGAQTYTITENFSYTSTAGGVGRGQFNLKKNIGTVRDGFFAVSRASALEDIEGKSHFFEFEAILSRPAGLLLQAPTSDTWVFRFNSADRLVIPFDRVKRNGTKITYDQSDRDLGGIRRLLFDSTTRRLTIRTWDLKQDELQGGTGLPRRGEPFTGFNFALRMELSQPDGTIFQAVTATRMTRRTRDDAFWQTGRRNKKQ